MSDLSKVALEDFIYTANKDGKITLYLVNDISPFTHTVYAENSGRTRAFDADTGKLIGAAGVYAKPFHETTVRPPYRTLETPLGLDPYQGITRK